MRRTSARSLPRTLVRSVVAALLALPALAVPAVATTTPAYASTLPYSGAVAIDGADNDMCVLRSDATVDCWGYGASYLLDNEQVSRSVPTTHPFVHDAAQVSVGYRRICARHTDATVSCWGLRPLVYQNTQYVYTAEAPTVVAGLTNVTDVAVGFGFVCVVVSGGTVKCWGQNNDGQLGQTPSNTVVDSPTTVAGLTGVVAITAGKRHVCARRTDQTVRCWGNNGNAQLGRGTSGGSSATPTSPSNLTAVLDVEAGLDHTCAVVQSGSNEVVRCWGWNTGNQVNDSEFDVVTGPAPAISGLNDATAVVGGSAHTCVLRQTGALVCWGSNSDGQSGTGFFEPTYQTSPVAVSGVSGATALAASSGSMCSVSSGTVSCWGSNRYGVLGRGDNVARVATPTPVVVGLAEFTPLSPARLLDTRPAGTTVDGVAQQGGVVAAGSTLELPVNGRGGIAASPRAVVLNVVAVNPSDGGFVTVWPCDQAKPLASNLNVIAGVTRANVVVVKVPSSGAKAGRVCLSPSIDTHLLADVSGYMGQPSPYVAVQPQRLVDTRPSGETIDGAHEKAGALVANQQYYFQISGRGGVPVNADAAVLNVTAANPAGTGFVTVWPCVGAAPTASNLNLKAGVNVANLVFAKLDAGGGICVKASIGTQLVVDLGGYMPDGSGYEPMTPFRLLDTRPAGVTVDGSYQGGGPATSKVVSVPRGTVMVARTVVLNVTAVNPAAGGYLRVYPCFTDNPNVSTVNFAAGATTANAAVLKVGSGDNVCITASTPVDMIVDVQGVYAY